MDRLAAAVRSLIVAAALLGGLALVSGVAAQETISLAIAKFTCPTDPGRVSLPAGNIPAECDPVAGVVFTAAAADGTDLGSCTTNADGLCRLDVPSGADVVVTEDVSTGPAGYRPRENPVRTRAVTEFANALFINLPEVTAPPTTGTGVAAPVAPMTGPAAIATGLVGLVVVIGAARPRRRTA